MTKCPSCKGSGYLRSVTGGPRFVCTNCDGHGVRGVAPMSGGRISCVHSRIRWDVQREAGLRDPNYAR